MSPSTPSMNRQTSESPNPQSYTQFLSVLVALIRIASHVDSNAASVALLESERPDFLAHSSLTIMVFCRNGSASLRITAKDDATNILPSCLSMSVAGYSGAPLEDTKSTSVQRCGCVSMV
jgi:hypothetical protein